MMQTKEKKTENAPRVNEVPVSDLCNRYEEVVNLCKATGEPVFLMDNGKPSLVAMDLQTYDKMVEEAAFRALVLKAHADFLANGKTHSLKEAFAAMDKAVGA